MMVEKTYPMCALERSTIYLGRQLDHNVRQIQFDVKEWLDQYPNATVSGFAVPPDGEGYPITLNLGNGVAAWKIQEADTATAGRGMVQLVLLGKNGEKLHSANAPTMIDASAAASAGTTPPDAAKPWFEELLEKIRQIEENGVTDEQIADALEEYLKEHPIGGVKPEDVKKAVRAALQEAKDSGEFDGKDGEPGAPGAPGYTPQKGIDYFDGAPGEAATFEIIGAESLPYGSKPTVTEEAGSTAQNRKYKLGIPEGAPGAPGSSTGGAAIDDTTPSANTTYSSSKIDALLNEQKEAIEKLEQSGVGGSLSVDENGDATIGGSTFAVDENGNAVI